ncbi:hypothetical protein [Escherichia phage vB-Eco-KMB37]|nr:hypothetical protein [Escherichia phage vB-Eco-KMB37]
MERVTGLEPAPGGWKPHMLPLTLYPLNNITLTYY